MASLDYYELLQISPNAEPETIHRVYRLLAQRFHPDNAATGNEERFRELTEAYAVLGDVQQRAKYDLVHTSLKAERWRLVSANPQTEDDHQTERATRLLLLELLYTKRRTEMDRPGLSLLDLEALTGRPREHLEFTMWFLTQKKYVTQSDGATFVITVDGIEYFERAFEDIPQRRRLNPPSSGLSESRVDP